MRVPIPPVFASLRSILRETCAPSPPTQLPPASPRPVAPPPGLSYAAFPAAETPHFRRPKVSRTTQHPERASRTVSAHRLSACPTNEKSPHQIGRAHV